MTEPEQSPTSDPRELSPVEHLDSDDARREPGGQDVHGAAPTPTAPRRRRKAIVASTLGVLLVLGAGGAVAATVVLHRPDVVLVRALSATESEAQGSMVLSVKADGAVLATAPDGMAQALGTSSLRYAWGPGEQQTSISYEGKQLGSVITTDTHFTVQVDLSNVPGGSAAAAQLSSMADALGPDGDALRALGAGRPVGVSTGPGSELRALAGNATKASGGAATSDLSPQRAAEVLDAITQSIKDNTTVTSVGSDADGDHFLATVSLKDVVGTVWARLGSLSAALAPATSKPDLSKLAGVTLGIDVWVRDGHISRVQVPLGALVRRLDPTAAAGDLTIVAVLSPDGIRAPTGSVTEVPDSLLRTIAGGSA